MDDPTISLSGGWKGDDPPLLAWGPFELQERVGIGGFGEVYRAFDPALQRLVAVKLLHNHGENRENQAAAILREARAMARVIHPNIVPIYGVQTYDNRPGFWGAFVKGKTLSALLLENGPFGPREAVHIGMDLCRALSAVHAAGLLHRDIKAGNAMREEGGRIVLMDFGLTQESDGVSHSGGTPGYVAPELRAGGKPTVRSDIYALGVLIYHLLTDRYPSEGDAQAWSLLGQRPDLPPELVGAVHTAIAPDPAKRFTNAAEMAAALSVAVSDTGTGPPLTSSSGPVAVKERPANKRRYAFASGGVICLAAAGWLLWTRMTPERGSSAISVAQGQYDAAHDLVRNFYRPGALSKAVPMLETITRASPAFAPAFADLGRADYLLFVQSQDSGYLEPARRASLTAVAIDPNQAAAYTTLGMLYTQQGKNGVAAQELDSALKVDQRDAEVWGARAELYRREGRNDDVVSALRKAMDLAPSDWRWPKQLADYYDHEGHYDLAIQANHDALRLSPDNGRILNNLGLNLWNADRLEEARTDLQKAIAIEPSPNRYSNLGGIERDLGNNSVAIALFQKAIALSPRDYHSWSYLAGTYERGHADPAKVRETYEKSISLGEELLKTEPGNTSLLADLGVMNATVGNYSKSVPYVRQAVALDPDNGDVLFIAGEAYELMHRRAEAIGLISSALRHGYSQKLVERSPELAALRTDKKYLAIAASLR